MPRPSDGNAQGRWSAASRRGTKSAGHSLLMPRPEVTAHPATAMHKAGKVVRGVPTRNKAGRSLVAHGAPGGHGPPSDGKAQGRWSAASRRGTKSAGHSLLMPHPEVTAHPPSDGKAQGRWSAASRRGTKTAGHSLLMPHPEVTAHPPSDGNAQGRWSAASRRGTKSAGHSLLMPRPEVTAHPATAMRKAGGPRRPDAEQSRQVTRCSCRARRSRPTQRRQCARQVVRGVPTRNKVGRTLVAHAAPGGRGPPSDGNAQGRWSAASRRGTNTQRIRALIAVS